MYTLDPPLPEVRAANREFAERKERKDAEKRRRDRRRKGREAREKENRTREKQSKLPIPTPDSTPEPESSASAEVEVNYSALPDPNAEGVKRQSPGQRGVGTEPPAQAEGEDTRAPSPEEGSPAQLNVGTLERVPPPRHQTGPGAAPGDRSSGAGGPVQAPKSGSKKSKLEAASR